jgi:hypothetical protein
VKYLFFVLGLFWLFLSVTAVQAAMQRYLANLSLGDTLREIHLIYRPAQEWPSYVEPKGRVDRIKVEGSWVKSMPLHIETLWLGMKKGRLAQIQVIYDAAYTLKKPWWAVAEEIAGIYGAPSCGEDSCSWSDDQIVLTVFDAQLPALKWGKQNIERRTAVELVEENLPRRVD